MVETPSGGRNSVLGPSPTFRGPYLSVKLVRREEALPQERVTTTMEVDPRGKEIP